jgi:glycerophosphoryl diester phosphodiesterase
MSIVVNGIEATVLIPENSLAAFTYSADNGINDDTRIHIIAFIVLCGFVDADGWELDTYLTKDGIPVVIHDEVTTHNYTCGHASFRVEYSLAHLYRSLIVY